MLNRKKKIDYSVFNKLQLKTVEEYDKEREKIIKKSIKIFSGVKFDDEEYIKELNKKLEPLVIRISEITALRVLSDMINKKEL